MKLEIYQPTIEQKHVLQNLMELYQYDFSEFESEDVDENGLYGYKYLDYYWTIPTHFPFLIKVDGNFAGFALVREIESEDSSCSYYLKICEFFIMKNYRKEGIGKQVAFHIFDLFQGVWEVAELETNLPAQNFWRKIISEYTNNEFVEIQRDHWPGPIQRFTNAERLTLQSLALIP